MNTFEKIGAYIARFDKKKLDLFIIVTISLLSLIAAGGFYFINLTRNKVLTRIEELQKIALENKELLIKYEAVSEEEQRIQNLLQENKNFNIKSFFEQFCRQHTLNPEPNWETETYQINDNETFEEIRLSAFFPNQTTEKLVSVLSVLDKNPLVYLKNVEITQQKQNTISFALTLATTKHKSLWEA